MGFEESFTARLFKKYEKNGEIFSAKREVIKYLSRAEDGKQFLFCCSENATTIRTDERAGVC